MEVIQIILGLAIGFLMGFLTSYYRQKGKNAALLSDIKRLTEEKENVKSKFQLEQLYDASSNLSSNMLRDMGENIISGNTNNIQTQQLQLTELANQIIQTREKLIEEVQKN